MPLPLLELNSLIISSKALPRAPLWLCQSVTWTGPDSEMAASVSCSVGLACGAGDAPVVGDPGEHGVTRNAATAKNAKDLRMSPFPSDTGCYPRIPVRATPSM